MQVEAKMLEKMDEIKLDIEASHQYNTVEIKKEVNTAKKATEDIIKRIDNL